MVKTSLMIFTCLLLLQIVNGKEYFHSSVELTDSVKENAVKYITLAFILLFVTFLQCITGFIGIIRNNISNLIAFQWLMVISMIISIVDLILSGEYILPLIVLLVKSVIILLTVKIIRMIRGAVFVV